MTEIYKVPDSCFFRLHHSRPRFKNDVESVLLFVCQRIANIEPTPTKEFNSQLFELLRLYPGNAMKAAKTINNWRTEIPALFGLVETGGGVSMPGLYAKRLAQNEDLVEFFRYFLLTFQYPGGHIKPEKAAQMIEVGVDFHPAKFIIDLFLEGQKLIAPEESFSVSSPELTALVFNDLRVTASKEFSPAEIANTILKNRAKKVVYDQTGDVIRYAQDILDYLVLADILSRRQSNGRYYLKPGGQAAALAISREAKKFEGYKYLYGLEKVNTQSVAALQHEWTNFVNQDRVSNLFAGDIFSLLESETDKNFNLQAAELIESIKNALIGTTKDIGYAGEAIVIDHEARRLKELGRPDLSKRVKKIPDHVGIGYDIQSFDVASEEIKISIEVKTTRSRGKLKTQSFTMTTNEWVTARTLGETYYVYRVIISEGSLRMFVIHNPYKQEQLGTLQMTPRNGAEISYTESAGRWLELLSSEK